jgi:hypothetical protein
VSRGCRSKAALVGGGPPAPRAGSREARRAQARPRSLPLAGVGTATLAEARPLAARWRGGPRGLAAAPCARRGRARGAHIHHAWLQRRRGLAQPATGVTARAAPDRGPVAPRPGSVRWRRSCRWRRLEPRALIPIDLPVDLVVVLEQQERERQARRGECTPASRVAGEGWLCRVGEHVFAR